MYQVYSGSYLLYDPRAANAIDKLIIRKPVVKMSTGSAGSFSFTADATHPQLANIKRMESVIKVTEDSSTVFLGRVITDKKDFYGSHVIECEGLLATLNDSVQPPFTFPDDVAQDPEYLAATNVIQYFIKKALERHNAQVGTNQQVQLGTVSVTDPNNYIARSSTEPLSTWEMLSTRLPGSSLGGYFVPRYEGETVYLDYTDDSLITTENIQEITFGENLLDLADDVNGADLYTAIYPVGADGLTIESIADGTYSGYTKSGNILSDATAAATYGQITKIIKYDGVTTAQQLLSHAVADLQTGSGVFPRTISVTAADLHLLDNQLQAFQVGKLIQVNSTPHGLSTTFPVSSVSLNLIEPGSTTLTLSKTLRTYTAEMDKKASEMGQTINTIQGTVADNYEDLDERVSTNESSIEQNAASITAAVSRIGAAESAITNISQTADAVSIRVDSIEQNGATKVRTGMGYTFDDDGLTIQLDGSQIENTIDNTGMYVKRAGEVMLQATASGVEARDLHANNYLIIGNNSRIEDYDDGTDNKRTGIFYIGG